MVYGRRSDSAQEGMQCINPVQLLLSSRAGRLSDGPTDRRLIYKHGPFAFTSLESPIGGI